MYVQSANMQFIHVPITALNYETVSAQSLDQLMKILIFLFLGQKEEENTKSHLKHR